MNPSLVLTQDAKELIALSRAMKKLLLSPEYLELKKIAERQVDTWKEIALQPTENRDYLRGEYNKGVLFGIRLNLTTPERIIADAQAIIFRMENPNERSSPNPSVQQPDLFGAGPRSRDTPESISEQLGEPVGPDARVTADSN